MSLRDTLRRAASLVIEFDEAPGADLSNTQQVKLSSDRLETQSDGLDELDARLAAGRKAIEQLERGETPSAPVQKTVEQVARDTPGPNLDQVSIASAPDPSPDGTVNFHAIFQAAGLPPVPFSAEQMLEMLASLPSELPLDVKRQTVRATLSSMGKAIGATQETIVGDTSRKLAALSAYVEDVTKKAADFAAAANSEITVLQKQIEEKKQAIQSIQVRQQQVVHACTKEADRLDDILEFLSLDVAPSKLAPEHAKTSGS